MFFKRREGEACVLVTNGVYRQCEVYERNGMLFGKVGAGFVRLMADGSTTKAKTRIDGLLCDGDLMRMPTGALCLGGLEATAKARPLDGPTSKKLLAAPDGSAS